MSKSVSSPLRRIIEYVSLPACRLTGCRIQMSNEGWGKKEKEKKKEKMKMKKKMKKKPTDGRTGGTIDQESGRGITILPL